MALVRRREGAGDSLKLDDTSGLDSERFADSSGWLAQVVRLGNESSCFSVPECDTWRTCESNGCQGNRDLDIDIVDKGKGENGGGLRSMVDY